MKGSSVLWAFITLCVVVALGAACGDDSGDDNEGHQIEMHDSSFQPSNIFRGPGSGDQFLITNEGSTEHTFTIDELSMDESLMPGESTTVVIPTDGDFEFYCRIHPSQMRGFIEDIRAT
jgi:plastocyanin